MADTAYIIRRAFQEGKALTTEQKSSSLFAEEPVVLGQVLRRGSRPLRISAESFEANKSKLLALEKAGSIVIVRPAHGEESELEKAAAKAAEEQAKIEAEKLAAQEAEKAAAEKAAAEAQEKAAAEKAEAERIAAEEASKKAQEPTPVVEVPTSKPSKKK